MEEIGGGFVMHVHLLALAATITLVFEHSFAFLVGKVRACCGGFISNFHGPPKRRWKFSAICAVKVSTGMPRISASPA